VARLRQCASLLHTALGKAESLHDNLEKQGKFLTSSGAEAMAAVRSASDALELAIGDEYWPLPRYREMLFPV
jgi:glutamine synthetase